MSERWGKCSVCRGHGYLIIKGEPSECGLCGGTGFGGNPEDAPWVKSAHEEAMQAAIEALNKYCIK